MFQLKVDEGEAIVKGLLAYSQHLHRRREFSTQHVERAAITETIAQNDKIIHMLDLRIAAAKDVANYDS